MEAFAQKLEENGYFRQEEFIFADCDRNKRARVSSLLSRRAAYAGYDYDARGLTHEKLYEMREVFLLSRMAVRIHDCPRYREVMDITTWENGTKGAHMQRFYEMRDQTGAVRVAIKSDWILVDPQTRHILRPASFTAGPSTPASPAPSTARTPGRSCCRRRVRRSWESGESCGPTWTATAMCTAATTATSSGTHCPRTCRTGCPGTFSSITARRPRWARSCGCWASGREMPIIWRASARRARALRRCANFKNGYVTTNS